MSPSNRKLDWFRVLDFRTMLIVHYKNIGDCSTNCLDQILNFHNYEKSHFLMNKNSRIISPN